MCPFLLPGSISSSSRKEFWGIYVPLDSVFLVHCYALHRCSTVLNFLCDRRLSDRDFSLKPAKIGLLLLAGSILRSSEQRIWSIFAPLDIPFLAQYRTVWNSSQTSARLPWETFKWLRFHGNNRWHRTQIALTSTSVIPDLRAIGWSYIVHNAVP